MAASRSWSSFAALSLFAACGSHALPDAAADAAATQPADPAGGAAEAVLRTTNAYTEWPNSLPSSPSFFPLAVWLQEPGNAAAYQQLGINVYVGLWQGPTSSQLQALQQAGMAAIAAQNGTGLGFAGVNPCRGWMHGDEPDNAQWNGSSYDPCIAPAVVEADYLRWKQADPTRPVFLNFGQGVAFESWIGRGTCTGQLGMYPDYMRGADIVCFDIYPVNSTYPQVAGNLWYVAQGVERLVQWNQQHFEGRKIVWNCVELSNIEGVALPTAAQVRAEVWMSIVHGSMGIVYFVHEFSPTFRSASILQRNEPQYQALRAGVTALNAQVQALAPVLNSATIHKGVVQQNPQAAAPIATMVKRYRDATYLFAVAMRDVPTTATFRVGGLSPAMRVEVVDEARTLQPNGNAITDAFGGYEVHIYKIY